MTDVETSSNILPSLFQNAQNSEPEKKTEKPKKKEGKKKDNKKKEDKKKKLEEKKIRENIENEINSNLKKKTELW